VFEICVNLFVLNVVRLYCCRFCEVHLALAELCVACRQHNDCYVHVRLVSSVLDPKKLGRRDFLSARAKSDAATSLVAKHSEGSDGEEEGMDFLRSCLTSVDYQTVSDPCGSPTTTERLTVSMPPTWKHRHTCKCILCTDPSLERIWLRGHIIEASNRLHQDNVFDSKSLLSAAGKQQERLTTNVSAQRSDFSLAVVDKHVKRQAVKQFSAVAVYQTDFHLIALILCEAAFRGKDSKHFSSCYTQAEELQSNYLPSDRSHIYLAELFYIGATPSLLWPSTAQLLPKVKLSIVDILCAGIGRVNVSDVATPPQSNKSQRADRVPSFVACDEDPLAAQKTCCGRTGASVVGAPVKSRPVAAKISGRAKNPPKENAPDVQVFASSLIGKKSQKGGHVLQPSGMSFWSWLTILKAATVRDRIWVRVSVRVTLAFDQYTALWSSLGNVGLSNGGPKSSYSFRALIILLGAEDNWIYLVIILEQFVVIASM